MGYNLQSTICEPQSNMLRIFTLLTTAIVMFACARDASLSKNAAEASPSPLRSATHEAGPKAGYDGHDGKTTEFDGERAFAHVKAQVGFGPRPSGSTAIEKTREYIVNELKSYGLNTSLDQFMPVTPHGRTRMANIIAELPGERSDSVIIASHYDTKNFKEFTFLGANDGGSSTGALLEVARIMAAEKAQGRPKRRYTYQFVFLDGEESICREWSECLNGNDNTYGSRRMVEQLRKEKQLNRIKAMILLDMVGDTDLAIPREEGSSAWLVEAIWSTAREAGYARHFPNRRHAITDDHIHFLQAGIPAVDLIDFDYGSNGDNRYWHTKEDTLDKISAQSLKIVGDVVLLSLPRIEAQIR